MKMFKAILAASGLAWFSTTVNATVFYIDQFQITRNDVSSWFNDTFADGLPPPYSESIFPSGNRASYLPLPDPLPGPKQNGKLTLDTSAGAQNTSAVTGAPILIQRARLDTNTNSDQAADNNGLKSHHTFEVTGVFDLIRPLVETEFYGIRLVDFDSPNTNDNVQLRVELTTGGELRVRFVKADFTLAVFNEISSYLLSGVANLDEYEQIALMLIKDKSDTSLITAAFELIDSNASVSNLMVSMEGNERIFNGERWTRAAFMAVAPRPVPEPATLLLLSLGLAGIGYKRHCSKKAAY